MLWDQLFRSLLAEAPRKLEEAHRDPQHVANSCSLKSSSCVEWSVDPEGAQGQCSTMKCGPLPGICAVKSVWGLPVNHAGGPSPEGRWYEWRSLSHVPLRDGGPRHSGEPLLATPSFQKLPAEAIWEQ